MRRLPKNKSDRHKLIITACQDYYGRGQNQKRANQIALYLMGRKKGVELTEQEKSDMWAIKTNLEDETYTTALL